jgi:hypothetical protein
MNKGLLFILCLSFITASSSFAQTKTVTNADLEKFKQKRLQAEREYSESYEKLGFPSPEELERRREQSRLEAEDVIARQKEERLEKENYFAAQARGLRSEIASVEAQINYVASQVSANQSPTSYFTGGIAPFGYGRAGQSGSIWSGDATGRIFLGIGNGRWRGRGGYGRYGQNGQRYNYRRNRSAYYVPFATENYSNNAPDELITQLRNLAQERAGLYAEWQLLQEEAKRAGVKID